MGTEEQARWPLAVLVCAAGAGLLFAASAAMSRGSDLRATGGDAASIVQQRTQQIAARRLEARRLQQSVDRLAATNRGATTSKDEQADDAELRAAGGLEAVNGAGIRIELSDTPRDVEFPGVNPNLLVVHQQDIQAFVNALWAGGAKAIALQGQRLVSTSGIKCVGNTVVIDGVPYSPPYVIEAIGPQLDLRVALEESTEVETYRLYARDYQLGLDEEDLPNLRVSGYDGPITFRYAKSLPVGESR